jgi:hypothetical protein
MHSAFDSYRSSSTAKSAPHYKSPSNYLDLNGAAGGSERAEFHDRYQNRVSIKTKRFFFK